MPAIASPAEPATKCRRLIPAIVSSLDATSLFVDGYPIRRQLVFPQFLEVKRQGCRAFLDSKKASGHLTNVSA
jgi:hypothetical protein